MALITNNGNLNLKGKQYILADFVSNLGYVSGIYIVSFLKEIGLTIPRKLRMNVLKQVLNDSVLKTIDERKTLADEMGYRLTWFHRYTDTQLVNLLEWYKSPSLNNNYIHDLNHAMVSYLVDSGVADNEIEKLMDYASGQAKVGKKTNVKEFNTELNAVLFDEPGEIDGVTQDQFRPVTFKSSTLTELRMLGEKYNAPIPKRLKKVEVLEIILAKLKERNQLTPTLEDKLKNQNIILLERYAKDNDIKVSTELKKEEIIEFILANAKETKESYFVPQSLDVYEKMIDEQVKEEPKKVIKEEVKPVVTEKIVEVPKAPTTVFPTQPTQVLQTFESIDYRPQFDRLSQAFESLAEAFSKKEFNVHVETHPVVQINTPNVDEVVRKVEPERIVEVQQIKTSSELSISNSQIIAELLKDDETDIPQLEPLDEEEINEVKLKRKNPGLLVVAAIFSFISFALCVVVGLTYIPALNFTIPMLDLSFIVLDQMMMLIILGTVALFDLLVGIRFLSKKVKKAELILYGILTLVTGFIITGIFALLGSKEVVLKKKFEPATETAKLIEAITQVNTASSPNKNKAKMSGFAKFFLWIFMLIFIIFAVLYALWRLGFTYGYENIPFIGPFIRDYILIPIFGSSHEMA